METEVTEPLNAFSVAVGALGAVVLAQINKAITALGQLLLVVIENKIAKEKAKRIPEIEDKD